LQQTQPVTSFTAPYLPQSGQLVEVRSRHFVVTDVRPSNLPPDVLGGDDLRRHHLVGLSSIEDDALGEELVVLWEVEPGAKVFERSALPKPDGFDEPGRLDAFLHAVRWGTVSSADRELLQAPFRSGIEIEDYQLEPLARALEMPRANLLIADDVGLGKTIEAGMVAQELIIRHRVRTVLVLCPASLQVQWKDQMRDKFGLEFRIIDSAAMKELRRRRGIHVNPWTHFPRLITSIDYLKRDRPMRLFRETLPPNGESSYPRRFDLLILDEAHNAAPSGKGQYALDSLRTQCVRGIAPHFEHKLFLTATPHNGYAESFTSLLELLDNQRFARGVQYDPKQLGRVMVRRMKSELMRNWDGSPRFPERKLEAIQVGYTDIERKAHELLREYTRLRLGGTAGTEEHFASEFVLKLLKKRLFSSPAAFATTLRRHRESLEHAKKRSHSPTPSPGLLRRLVDGVEEEYADDDAYEDSTGDATEGASRLFRPLTQQEEQTLSALERWADTAAPRADSKADKLITWLKANIKPDGAWGSRRVLIFTEYRATQKWLQGLLAAAGLATQERLEVMYGGMSTDERERIKAAFQADPDVSKVRILLATDAASEGIDLQNHCAHLIHYEIPWNPNRMEQRNGRLDRHGQKADAVMVYHFVGGRMRQSDTDLRPGDLDGDLEFLMRVALKINAIREDIGKVGPVLARQVEEAMLGRRQGIDTAQAEVESRPLRKQLRFETDLRERIQRLEMLLRHAEIDLDITPAQTKRIVDIALELAGQPPLHAWHLPARDGRSAVDGWMLPHLTGSWTTCADGMLHPHTKAPRPLVFDRSQAVGRDDVVLAHLNHRLVSMSLRLLRAEIWSTGGRRGLHRVAIRLVDDAVAPSVMVVAHGRLVVIGGDGVRLHEEVIFAGGLIEAGKFKRMNVRDIEKVIARATNDTASETMQDKLRSLWGTLEAPLAAALDTRMRDRTKTLQQKLAEREQRDIADISGVLRELERAIRSELDATEPEQIELWTTDEREQLKRNRGSLERRLRDIPHEIEKEVETVRARYADPQPRMFPVAVEFLVPKKLNK
jgi:superfamily II DNA or RNA helicase